MNGTRDRDRAVERLLRQSLETPRNASVTESCLDAETAAAWVDGGLSGAALELAQSHVADCARCQALVGTVARLNSLVPAAEPERASRRWLAWAVPLTAAAAGLALWIAVPGSKPDGNVLLPQATESQRQAAEAKLQEPVLPGEPPQTSRAPARENRAGRQSPPAAPADQLKKEAGDNQPVPQASELRRDAERFEADTLKAQPAPSSAVAPSAAAEQRPPPSAGAGAPTALDESVNSVRSAARVAQTLGLDIVSPDPLVRWRIAGSAVQRSTDGGVRWEAESTGVASALTGGAAPSATVCWLVGRAGVVLLTTDGRTWRRVPFPEATDLSAVQATNARVASVSTADGRTFTTSDGGVTWLRRPLQEF